MPPAEDGKVRGQMKEFGSPYGHKCQSETYKILAVLDKPKVDAANSPNNAPAASVDDKKT
jgi:hypothetical protein